jgi:hypothetical protein
VRLRRLGFFHTGEPVRKITILGGQIQAGED